MVLTTNGPKVEYLRLKDAGHWVKCTFWEGGDLMRLRCPLLKVHVRGHFLDISSFTLTSHAKPIFALSTHCSNKVLQLLLNTFRFCCALLFLAVVSIQHFTRKNFLSNGASLLKR